jgi:hypothetical protein
VFQPTHGARFVGWANAEFLYLDKEAAFAAVSGFSPRGNIPLWHRPKGALGAMSRSGKSLADMGRSDTTAKIEGKTKGIIQIPRGLDGDHGSAYLPSAARIGGSPRTPVRAVTAVTKNPR